MGLMKKKQTKKSLLRQWGLPESFQWRSLAYKQPYQKGIYWYWFSIFIRQRDVEKWGTCISCDKPITMHCDAGHFMPAADCGRDLLFDPINVNAEHKYCNAFDKTHLLGYEENLDKRYGEGTAKKLRERRQAHKESKEVVKDLKPAEYEQKIKDIWVLLREMGVDCPQDISREGVTIK